MDPAFQFFSVPLLEGTELPSLSSVSDVTIRILPNGTNQLRARICAASSWRQSSLRHHFSGFHFYPPPPLLDPNSLDKTPPARVRYIRVEESF